MHVNEAAALISQDASLGGLQCQLVISVVRLDPASIWSEDFTGINQRYRKGLGCDGQTDQLPLPNNPQGAAWDYCT